MCNGPEKNVLAGVGRPNLKSRNLFGNVETGLEMLFSSAILLWTLVMNQSRVVVTFFDSLTQRSVTRPRPISCEPGLS